jgi:hypothetical protein
MESLYVCLFSNGHIKVGRSADVGERIRQHMERVSCLGVKLQHSMHFPCVGSAARAEAALIARCNEKAKGRHKNEWFYGLLYTDAAMWAEECAALAEPAAEVQPEIDYDSPDFRSVLAHLKLAGRTQVEIALYCGCGQSSISDIATGVTKDPSYSVGSALLRMARLTESQPA